jgi:PhnB protein
MAVKPIPEGYHTVTPYLVVEDAAALIDFLKQAFDAEERHRMARPDGTIMHAEVKIGDSFLMLGNSSAEHKPLQCMIYLYVEDADATYQRAIQAGATSVMAPADQFYGDRNGGVKDSWGNFWWIGTHIEDVSSEEVARRAQAQKPR